MRRTGYLCVIVLIGITVVNEIKSVSAQNVSESSISTVSSPAPPAAVLSTTTRKPFLPSFRLPCSCFEGQCGCCTGYILDRLNQKACMNMTYEPEEFAINAVMSLNGVPFYQNTFSGKNPPPICVRLPRIRFIKFCVEFSNVYFANRNVHLCIDAEANWEDFTLLEWSFDCVRMGMSGFAIINPEDGGGLPERPIDSVDQTNEDYDDSARNNPLISENHDDKETKIIFHRSLKKVKGTSSDKSLVSVQKGRGGNFIVFLRDNIGE